MIKASEACLRRHGVGHFPSEIQALEHWHCCIQSVWSLHPPQMPMLIRETPFEFMLPGI